MLGCRILINIPPLEDHCKYFERLNILSPALLLQSEPAGDPVWCCLWHLLHVQGKLLDIQLEVLSNSFQTDGTIDKIFTGGAGKAGSTVAVRVIQIIYPNVL